MPETCSHLATLFSKFVVRVSVSEWGEVTIVCKECRMAWFLEQVDEQSSAWRTRTLEPHELQEKEEDLRRDPGNKFAWSSEHR